MLVWINGPFGVGKTTAANHLAAARPRCRHYDAETVGSMLRANLVGVSIGDFQHLAAWRRLVPIVAKELADQTGDDLVMVQTVMRPTYRAELGEGLEAAGIDVLQVLLDAAPQVLRERIEGDPLGLLAPGAAQWRMEHAEVYATAREAMIRDSDILIDTSDLDPEGVAQHLLRQLPEEWGAERSSAP